MKRIIALVLLLLFCLPTISFGHSGGTDIYGGHHDYDNVSGLGNYHYHHGFGPHLHPGGICPFETTVQEVTSSQEVTQPDDTQYNTDTSISVDAQIAQSNAIARAAMDERVHERNVQIGKAILIFVSILGLLTVFGLMWWNRNQNDA